MITSLNCHQKIVTGCELLVSGCADGAVGEVPVHSMQVVHFRTFSAKMASQVVDFRAFLDLAKEEMRNVQKIHKLGCEKTGELFNVRADLSKVSKSKVGAKRCLALRDFAGRCEGLSGNAPSLRGQKSGAGRSMRKPLYLRDNPNFWCCKPLYLRHRWGTPRSFCASLGGIEG